jgi:hypothetical protein
VLISVLSWERFGIYRTTPQTDLTPELPLFTPPANYIEDGRQNTCGYSQAAQIGSAGGAGMIIDDGTLKKLLRINDELMQLCKWLNEKARHGNFIPPYTPS